MPPPGDDASPDLATLVSNLPGMAYRCRNDPNWTMLFVSQGCKDLLGCNPEDLLKARRGAYADFILPEDRSQVEMEVAEGLAATGAFELTYRVRTQDGHIKTVWERGRLADRDPPCGHLEGFIMDISRFRSAEEALRQSEQRYRTLTEMSPDQIVIVDRDGLILFANSTATATVNWRREEVLNRHLSEVFAPETCQRMMGAILACLETGQPVNRISRLLYPGGPLWLDINLVPLLDDQGRAAAAMVVARNVTAAREAEESIRGAAVELQRSNAELERFALVASHDLQEPLRSVTGFSRLLLKRFGADLDEEARQYLQQALAGAQRMETLIQDLLTYARVGNARTEKAPVELGALVEEALENLRAARDQKAARIVWQDLPRIHGDRAQLRQLLQNLLGNALKFTGEARPEIEIRARDDGATWEVAISDNGVGLDPLDRERAFEVFTRLNPREAYPGSGVGLAVCRRIVEHHGGRIWLDSRPGAGTTVFFTLPKAPPEAP